MTLKSLDEKIKELTDKHNKEVAAIERHEELTKLYPVLAGASYFDYELYGRRASLTFDIETASQAVDILKSLNGIKLAPLYLVRDGCVSFKCVLTEKDARAEVTPIAPIIYKIDSFKSAIEFFVELDGDIFEIILSSKFQHMPFSRLMWRRLTYKSENSEKVIDCHLHYASDFMDRQVNYWSSSIETRGYSIYCTRPAIGLDELIAELERIAR